MTARVCRPAPRIGEPADQMEPLPERVRHEPASQRGHRPELRRPGRSGVPRLGPGPGQGRRRPHSTLRRPHHGHHPQQGPGARRTAPPRLVDQIRQEQVEVAVRRRPGQNRRPGTDQPELGVQRRSATEQPVDAREQDVGHRLRPWHPQPGCGPDGPDGPPSPPPSPDRSRTTADLAATASRCRRLRCCLPPPDTTPPSRSGGRPTAKPRRHAHRQSPVQPRCSATRRALAGSSAPI